MAVRRLIADIARQSNLLDQACQRPSSKHAGNNVPGSPEGNTADKALRMPYRARDFAPPARPTLRVVKGGRA
jgi:hypothetical protein